MKYLFSFSLLLMSFASQALVTKAVVRVNPKLAKIQDVEIKDLYREDRFDGPFFKIVKGKSEEAVSTHDDPDLVLKASTTYYHLTKAHEFFINQAKSEYVKTLKKMTVRIDMTTAWNAVGKYAHENTPLEYNNVKSVPSGVNHRTKETWGREIWFRPAKKIHRRQDPMRMSNQKYSALLQNFRQQVHMITFTRFLLSIIQKQFSFSTAAPLDYFRTFGASLILELAYQGMDSMNKALGRRYYWLDSALIPEVIYHEYAHMALSDRMQLSHDNTVNEGIADFFAGKIGNNTEVATHIKKYNAYAGKKAKHRQDYQVQFDTSEWAHSDFVFGLLWHLGDVLGEKQVIPFVYQLRNELTSSATIRVQLIEGILNTCDLLCEDPVNQRLKIFRMLNARKI